MIPRHTLPLLALLHSTTTIGAQPLDCHVSQVDEESYEGSCDSKEFQAGLELEPTGALLFSGTLDLGDGTVFPVRLDLRQSKGQEPTLFTPLGWFPLRTLDRTPVSLSFALHLNRMTDPDEVDARILKRARELLDVESRWDRNDDQVCEPSDETFSLYCALHRAMGEITGGYEHRRPALQEVRLTVEQVTARREFQHRLMDFNNLESTSLRDVHRVLDITRSRVEAKIAGEATIALRGYSTLGIEEERSPFVAFGDLDGDGDTDAVVANGRHWPGQNRVFFNNGEALFGLSRPLGDEQAPSYAAPLADLDGDGDLDIAVGNDRVRNLIFFNDGSGHFVAGPSFGGIESTRGVTLADLDNDRAVDILLTNRGDENAIYFNDGKGGFERSISFGSADDSTIDVAVGDLDHDGDLDLVLANRDGQPNAILLNDGSGRFAETKAYGTGSDETRSVAIADLDLDGHLDIVTANIGEQNGLYFGDGKGGVREGALFGREDGNSYTVALADMDYDGDIDIVIGNVGQYNVVYLNRGDGREFVELRFGLERGYTYGVDVADLNGDHFPEVATANSDGPNGLFRNTGLTVSRRR